MLATLADAWRWYEGVRTLTLAMRQLGKKYWDNLPWEGELGRDNRLQQLASPDILNHSNAVLDDLDDLCVLLLFSVFEATVRAQVQAEVAAEVPLVRHVALQHAIEALQEAIEHGGFARVLEPYKSIDPDFLELVSQVRKYRNWVAHGRRGEKPLTIQPSAAYDRLQRFLEQFIRTPAPPASAS